MDAAADGTEGERGVGRKRRLGESDEGRRRSGAAPVGERGDVPLSIEQVERLNTPMQASGLSLAADPESGEPFLAVCDHDGTGVRLYTAR